MMRPKGFFAKIVSTLVAASLIVVSPGAGASRAAAQVVAAPAGAVSGNAAAAIGAGVSGQWTPRAGAPALSAASLRLSPSLSSEFTPSPAIRGIAAPLSAARSDTGAPGIVPAAKEFSPEASWQDGPAAPEAVGKAAPKAVGKASPGRATISPGDARHGGASAPPGRSSLGRIARVSRRLISGARLSGVELKEAADFTNAPAVLRRGADGVAPVAALGSLSARPGLKPFGPAGTRNGIFASPPGNSGPAAGPKASRSAAPGRLSRALGKIVPGRLRAMGTRVKDLVLGERAFDFALQPHRKKFYGAMGFLIVDGFLSMGVLSLLQPLLDLGVEALAAGAVAPFALKMSLYSAAIVGLLVLYAFTERQHTLLGGLATIFTVRELRNAFRRKFERLDMGFHSEYSSGALSNRLRDDTAALAEKNVSVRYVLPHYITVFLFSTAAMFWYLPALAPLVLAVVVPIGILSAVYGEKLEDLGIRHQDLKAKLASHSEEVFASIDVVKSFAAGDFEAARYDEAVDALKENDEKDAVVMAKYYALNGAFSELFTRFLVFGAGAYLIAAATGLSFGMVAAFAGFAYMASYSLNGLASNYLGYKRNEGKSALLRELWTRDSKISDPDSPAGIGRAEGRIAFEGVSFKYEPRPGEVESPRPVLDGVSFSVEPGETVAFVGETGSGKSTIVNLIERLWDPGSGRITLDGIDLKDFAVKDLRRNISMVLQDNRLFDESIRYNVAYGRESATDAEIVAALKMAQADFVFDKGITPLGLDAPVGKGGRELSGGQRQRIAIARALLVDAPVLLLDEATASLDNENEREVQAAIQVLLDEAGGKRSTIVIAHRLSTIRGADRIFVLDKGRIVESGTWDELNAKRGAFYRMRTAREAEESQSPPATAAGQLAAAGVSLAVAAGAAIAGTSLLSAVPWAAAAFVPVAGFSLLAAAAFALTGRAVYRTLKDSMKEADANDAIVAGRKGPLGEPIATAEKNAEEFAALPERFRRFIELHENAHRERGVGELRATIAQLAGVLPLLRGQIGALWASAKEAGALGREFVFGDKALADILKKYSWVIAGVALLMALHAYLAVQAAAATGDILNAGIAIGDGASAASPASLLRPIGILAGIMGLSSVIQYVTLKAQGLLNVRLIADLRKALNRHLKSRSMRFFQKEKPGELSSRLNGEDLELLASKNAALRIPLLQHFAFLGFASYMLLGLNGWLGFGVFLLIPVLSKVNAYFGGRMSKVGSRMMKVRAEVLDVGQEGMGLIKTTKVFNAQDKQDERYAKKNLELTEVGEEYYALHANQWMLESSLTDLFTKHLIYIAGAWMIALGSGLSAGGVIATTLAAAYIKSSLSGISQNWILFKQYRGASAEALAWFKERADEKAAEAAGSAAKLAEVGELRGSVSFQGVGFRYDQSEGAELTLKDFSLDVAPGETVAFVGGSGSGKSTAMRLVQKLYEPESGRILIDGRDLRELDAESLNRRVALVPQEPPLFNNSIRYNLTYGREASEAEIARAIELADAKFVYDLPGGLDTQVGEAGGLLSGGQKQRIAISRAILRDAKILILDEATSALDGATEARVQAALEKAGKPTTLVVAHNLQTVKRADRIVVMERGRIVEIGSHAELLAKGGRYKSLWDASLKGPES